jgi:hypothetical protein
MTHGPKKMTHWRLPPMTRAVELINHNHHIIAADGQGSHNHHGHQMHLKK